jgi:hypothetical protein
VSGTFDWHVKAIEGVWHLQRRSKAIEGVRHLQRAFNAGRTTSPEPRHSAAARLEDLVAGH